MAPRTRILAVAAAFVALTLSGTALPGAASAAPTAESGVGPASQNRQISARIAPDRTASGYTIPDHAAPDHAAPDRTVAARAALGTATFGIQPVPRKNDNRSWFSFGATGGASTKDAVQVDNFGEQALTLHVYASDGVNDAEGGFGLLAGAEPSKDVGAWVTFPDTKPFVTIPPRTNVVIPFTITIPSNATPGDHAGGVVAALTTPSVDAKGNRVNVEQRVGSRVYIRVAGALKASMAVSRVSAVYHPNWSPLGEGSATVTYTVTNDGNVRLGAKQAVRITSLVGGSVPADAVAGVEELLPGNSVTVTTHAHGIVPSFTSTARIAVDPVARPGDVDPQIVGISKTATMATVPWSALIGLVLLGGLGWAFWFRRRRAGTPGAFESRRGKSQSTDSGPAVEPTSADAAADPAADPAASHAAKHAAEPVS